VGIFAGGDVVIISFPFSDLSGVKLRPALVLCDLPGEDLILCQISARIREDEYNVALMENDFIDGKLKANSVIRPYRLFTANNDLIKYKACRIIPEKIKEVQRILSNILIN